MTGSGWFGTECRQTLDAALHMAAQHATVQRVTPNDMLLAGMRATGSPRCRSDAPAGPVFGPTTLDIARANECAEVCAGEGIPRMSVCSRIFHHPAVAKRARSFGYRPRSNGMSKEMVVSASAHDTKIAILEDGQVVEVYFERQQEYSLAGSIYK